MCPEDERFSVCLWDSEMISVNQYHISYFWSFES